MIAKELGQAQRHRLQRRPGEECEGEQELRPHKEKGVGYGGDDAWQHDGKDDRPEDLELGTTVHEGGFVELPWNGLQIADKQVDGEGYRYRDIGEDHPGIAVQQADLGEHDEWRIFDLLKLPPDFEAALGEPFLGSPRLDFSYATGDGRQIDIGLTAAPLNTPSGRAGFLFAFQDVTESRKIEREARIQQRLAAVGEMAAGIAHEIRNPLASMSGSIQILREELPLTSEQAQLMGIVLRESERLNETIKSFLAYARPQRFSTVRLDVRRVLNDAALLLRHSAESGEGHQVDVDVPADPVWYEADEGQIRQIIWNLATNGLRAMPDGGRLLLSAARAPHGTAAGDVILSVQDQGVGIASEELDGILQPFRGTFAKGSGLGLAIVHRIVSDYGGEIKVTSHQDVGTTVTVRLPVGDQRPAATMGSHTVSPERRISPVRVHSEP